MDKDKGAGGHKGHLGHTVSHTDTASGKGSGQITRDPDDTSPTNRQTGVAGENAKNSDFTSPSGRLKGQDPEDVAERMGTGGKDNGAA